MRYPAVAVLVAGGFHTAPITRLLKEKNVSYIVITPTVDKLTDADHALYVKRLNGDYLTEEEVLAEGPDKKSTLYQVARAHGLVKSQGWGLAKLWPGAAAKQGGGERKTLAVGINMQHQTTITVGQEMGWSQKLGLTNIANGSFPRVTMSPYDIATQNGP